MAGSVVQRRLAAILVADIVGFSRLMEADETGTLNRLKTLWTGKVAPLVDAHGGRVFKTTGDGALVEFLSAVDAVGCALAIQRAIASAPGEGGGLQYRIGLHLGDVVVDSDDMFGDGINIAARLEGLAPPGGIALSGSIHEHVAGKVDAAFADEGERPVKNISRPIRVWSWAPNAQADVGERRAAQNFATDDSRHGSGGAGRNPVVAIAGFAIRGGDAETLDFAETLADELAAVFARRRGIEVVARGAIAKSGAAAGDLSTLHAATGADYVLTGGIQRSGTRIRVTAEMVDAVSGNQFWSERYDRQWTDPFELVDNLIEHISTGVRTAMNAEDGRRFDEKAAEKLTNAQRRAKAAEHFYKFTRSDILAAKALLDTVLEHDPDDAMALAMLAFGLWYLSYLDLYRDEPAVSERIVELANRSVECDRNSDYSYRTRALAKLFVMGDCAGALADSERSLSLSPGYSLALHMKGEALVFAGHEAEGIALLRRLNEMNPRDQINFFRGMTIAIGHFALGELEAALEATDYSLSAAFGLPMIECTRVAVLSEMGRVEEARAGMATVLARWPEATARNIKLPPFANAAHRDRFVRALVVAGLPK